MRKNLNYSNITVIIVLFSLGRTIPSFRMVIDHEIEVLTRTFGKKLSDKEQRKLLREHAAVVQEALSFLLRECATHSDALNSLGGTSRAGKISR